MYKVVAINNMKYLLPILVLLPFGFVFAQEKGPELQEAYGFTFAESVQIDDGVLYYADADTNTLIGSAHDTDGNGELDVWISYVADFATEERYDTTGDGQPDTTVTLSQEELVTGLEGEAAASFTPEPTTPFVPATVASPDAGDDLVGDLSDITIDEANNGWVFFVILLLVGGLLYLFWQRQQD